MEIKIRGVDPVAVKKIDEMASKKGISRNEYLKEMIHASAALQAIKATEDKYEQLVQSLISILIQNTETIEKFNSSMGYWEMLLNERRKENTD